MSTDEHQGQDSAEWRIDFSQAWRVWLRIGLLGFGGPAGQIALMHRELVEQRQWISESRFLHALNYCMLLPGPEAQQLAVYIGWLLHRTWGGIVAGVLFVLPGAVVLALLSAAYVHFGDLPLMSALFFGLKAAVLALVIEAVLRIGRRALKTRFLVVVAIAAFFAIYALRIPFPWIVLVAALCGLFARRHAAHWLPAMTDGKTSNDRHFAVDRMLANGTATHTSPSFARAIRAGLVCVLLWSAPVLLAMYWLGSSHIVATQGFFFSQTALVTFGGAYAVLAYVAQRAVEDLHWLTPVEMVDGLALAETTPGPLVMVLQFVAFVAAYRHPGTLDPWVAACLGAAITTWVTFVPCFLFIFVGAPFIESLRQHRGLHAALSTITAAVVGVILSLSLWFAVHTWFDEVGVGHAGPFEFDIPHWRSVEPGAIFLTAAALIATLKYRLSMGWTLLFSALLGVVYRLSRPLF